jgi:hypothetical protein
MANWLVQLLILMGVLAILIIAGWYILSQVQMPDPIRRIVIIVLVVIVAVIACWALLSLPGGPRIGSHESQFPTISAVMPPTRIMTSEN